MRYKTAEYNLDYLLSMDVDFDKYPICRGNLTNLHCIMNNSITKVIIDGDDKALALISVMILHTGVATIFVIPSKDAHSLKKKTFIATVVSLRSTLDEIVKEHKLRRVETLTIDEEKHNTWMKFHGFQMEGVKRKYGINGEDYKMWSKLCWKRC